MVRSLTPEKKSACRDLRYQVKFDMMHPQHGGVKRNWIKNTICPHCGWDRSLLIIRRYRFNIKKYQIQCSHCLWLSKPSLFKRQALRHYKNKDGSMTIRRERYWHG